MKEILNSLLSNDVLNIIFLFLITVFTNSLSTMKTMFVSKKILKPAYVIVFIDSLIFATIMKQITSGDNIYYMLAFALGKSVGVYVGSLMEDKIAIGINQVDLFISNKEKAIMTADILREAGYTVNNTLTYGFKGQKRYLIETIVSRKEMDNYLRLLKTAGIENPTLKIQSLNKVKGKITPNSIE